MSDDVRTAKLFTIEQANAMLPLVRAIVADIVELSRDMLERRTRIAALRRGTAGDRDLYLDELSQSEIDLKKDTCRLREYSDELRRLGVELKSGPEGLVDFPSRLDGRVVYLCWKYDEPELRYWHDLNAGFAGRRPLLTGTGSCARHQCGEA
ncbi:MAG: DUF2203 family protein [Planctomycetes bacterium]|nr:DUF2203 family protein [Planctomycetota bacterium]